MWGPRSIAKLVQITPITMVYGTQITIVMGVYKPTYNWGGPTLWENTPVTHRHRRASAAPPFPSAVRVESPPHEPSRSLPRCPLAMVVMARLRKRTSPRNGSGFVLKGSLRIIWKKHQKRWNSKHRTEQKNKPFYMFLGSLSMILM